MDNRMTLILPASPWMTLDVARHRLAPWPLLAPLGLLLALVTLPARADGSDPVWEGALGLTGSNAPEYQGAADRVTKIVPGFFLRYGRLTVTNASGFVTRRADDVERGLLAETRRGPERRADAYFSTVRIAVVTASLEPGPTIT